LSKKTQPKPSEQEKPPTIRSQAVIVVTVTNDNFLDVRSYGSPESGTKDAEQFADQVVALIRSVLENPFEMKDGKLVRREKPKPETPE
jgi:hypothetical protein